MSKKTFFVLTLLLLLVAAGLPAKAELVASYQFEDNYNDSAPNPAPGTPIGGPTFEASKDGSYGKCLRLVNSSNQYVDCGQPTKLQITSSITMMAWVKVNSWAGGMYTFLLGRGDDSWRLGRATNANGAAVAVNSAAGTTAASINGTTNINDGQWHHVAGTFNGSTLLLYVDGVQDGTASWTGTINPSAQPFCIGANTTYPTALRCWDGWVDDVRIYDTALSLSEIQAAKDSALSTGPNPYATAISPTNGQLEVPVNAVLSWNAGAYAAKHNVYFDTDFDDVNTATTASTNVTKSLLQSGTTFDPDALAYNTTYYWRIDEVNSPGAADSDTYKGFVWKFTTDLSGYPIGYADTPIGTDRITATASSKLNTSTTYAYDPNKTILLNNSGLAKGPGPYKDYYVDANHGTVGANNMWLTMPNDPNRWIQYIFDKPYKLSDILVWNYNETTPLKVIGIRLSGLGIMDVNIYTTPDYGLNWSVPMQTRLKQATEYPTYWAQDPLNGNDVNMANITVTGVKLQAINNWSGGKYSAYGLSEVMFMTAPTYASKHTVTAKGAAIATATATVDPNVPTDMLNWKIGRDGSKSTVANLHQLYIKGIDNDALSNATVDPNSGRDPVRDGTATMITRTDPNYLLANLNSGLGLNMQSTYYWRVDEVIPGSGTWMNNSKKNKYKDIQSFRTVGSRLFENFDGSAWTGDTSYTSTAIYRSSTRSRMITYDNTISVDPYIAFQVGPYPANVYAIKQNDLKPGNPTNLVVWFYGDPNNAGSKLSIIINGTTFEYGTGAGENAAKVAYPYWTQWNIPIGSVLNLNNVAEFTIKITGGGALTKYYIDDMSLYRLVPAAQDPGITNLLAYYKFENNPNDSSGNTPAKNGTVRGAITYVDSLSPIYSKAMDDANSGAIDLGTDSAFNDPPGSLSIAFWVYLRYWSTYNIAYSPVFIGNRGDDSVGWQIRRNSGSNLIEFTTATGASNAMQYCTSTAVPSTGQWIHVACVFDSANKTDKMYVNGALNNTTTTTQSKIPAAKSGANYYKTFIGARPTAAGSSIITYERALHGRMDEVRIYNKALTANEVMYLSNPVPTVTPTP